MNVKFNKSRLTFCRVLPKDFEYKDILFADSCMAESLLHYNQTIGSPVSFLEDTLHYYATYKYDVSALWGKILNISMIRANYKSAIAFVDANGLVVDYRKSLNGESYGSSVIVSADVVVPENTKYLYVTASSNYVSLGASHTKGYFRDITGSLEILGDISNGYYKGLCDSVLTEAYCRAAKYVANEDCVLHIQCSTIIKKILGSLFVVDGVGIDVNLPDGIISEVIGQEAQTTPLPICPIDCYLPVKKGSELYINFRYDNGIIPTDQYLYGDIPIKELKVEKIVE